MKETPSATSSRDGVSSISRWACIGRTASSCSKAPRELQVPEQGVRVDHDALHGFFAIARTDNRRAEGDPRRRELLRCRRLEMREHSHAGSHALKPRGATAISCWRSRTTSAEVLRPSRLASNFSAASKSGSIRTVKVDVFAMPSFCNTFDAQRQSAADTRHPEPRRTSIVDYARSSSPRWRRGAACSVSCETSWRARACPADVGRRRSPRTPADRCDALRRLSARPRRLRGDGRSP